MKIQGSVNLAAGQSEAVRILIPVNKCENMVAGVSKEQLEARLRENLQADCCALSVVSAQPMEV